MTVRQYRNLIAVRHNIVGENEFFEIFTYWMSPNIKTNNPEIVNPFIIRETRRISQIIQTFFADWSSYAFICSLFTKRV